MSFFSNIPINIENFQSRDEEEETAEEQQRRQEEINNFLANEFNSFHYDESTVNSSIASIEETRHNTNEIRHPIESPNCGKNDSKLDPHTLNEDSIVERHLYKDTKMQDQLNVLYGVRVREIKSLKEEFENYKIEKNKEIGVLKNKAILAEAEKRHTQTSLGNSESLLVEKTELIAQLKQELDKKNEERNYLEQTVKDMNLEICTYKSMVTELQLKQNDCNSFGSSTRKNHSEELQKVHNDQILKLQSIAQEESKRSQVLEKQNVRLENEIKKIIESKSEADNVNNLTIIGLSKKLQTSQQQSEHLFLLGEALKKENDHMKGRLDQIENNQLIVTDGEESDKDLDKMLGSTEKLRQMLLDRDVELNTLKAKLICFDSDLKELFEYRKMLRELSEMPIKRCSNYEHEELLIFMQGQIQSFEQAVEDRNNQIMNLQRDKNELQEQIQLGIQQTRAELERLSHRYSLPQLETMSNELKKAEDTIVALKEQLIEKENVIKNIDEKMLHFSTLEQDLKHAKDGYNHLQKLLEDFKTKEVELTEENARIVTLLDFKNEDFGNKKVANVHKLYQLKQELAKYLKELQTQNSDFVEEVERWATLLDDCLTFSPIESGDNDLETLKKEKSELTHQINCCRKEIETANQEISVLKEINLSYNNEIEENKLKIKQLIDDLHNSNKHVQAVDENRERLETQLQNLQKELTSAREEMLDVHKQMNENNGDSVAKCEQTKNSVFDKILQAEILKAELNLREKIQQETILKMQNIEEQYSKALNEKSETYNKDKDKLKKLESTYRKQLAAVLEECGKKIEALESENDVLIKQTNALVQEYKTYRNTVEVNNQRYQNMILESKRNTAALNKKWVSVLDSYVRNFSSIQGHTQDTFKVISNKIAAGQKDIDLIDIIYKDRIAKIKNRK